MERRMFETPDWLIGLCAVLFPGAAWVGRLQQRVNHNETEIAALREVPERLARIEAQLDMLLGEVRSES